LPRQPPPIALPVTVISGVSQIVFNFMTIVASFHHHWNGSPPVGGVLRFVEAPGRGRSLAFWIDPEARTLPPVRPLAARQLTRKHR